MQGVVVLPIMGNATEMWLPMDIGEADYMGVYLKRYEGF